LTAVRSLLFVALFYLWSVLVAVGCTPILLLSHEATLRMFRIWSAGVLRLLPVCGVRVEVRGRQYVPTGAALVAPKHQCMLDVFAQFGVLPASAFVMKQELKKIPWFSWYAVRVGSIILDRKAGSAAVRKLVIEARALVAGDRQVVIFPEGTRTKPGAPPAYKPGIAALYREFGVPVYPVATNSGVHWPAHGFMRRPGVIVFEYLEPIPPGLKRAEFMRILEERIETASTRLLSE
jgi:1-acyl-sn-glycerol-3-phosphate acyltransferase